MAKNKPEIVRDTMDVRIKANCPDKEQSFEGFTLTHEWQELPRDVATRAGTEPSVFEAKENHPQPEPLVKPSGTMTSTEVADAPAKRKAAEAATAETRRQIEEDEQVAREVALKSLSPQAPWIAASDGVAVSAGMARSSGKLTARSR